jgi:hypothetical protein
MSYNLTDLSNALGAYHRAHTSDIVRRRVYNPMDALAESPYTIWDVFAKRFMKDEESFARLDVNLEVREADAQIVEQSADTITIDGDVRKIRYMETISKLNPSVLERTWLDHVRDRRHKFRDQQNLQDVEFVPWLLQYVVDRWLEKARTISLIRGKYTSGFSYTDPSNGDPWSWLAALDGILETITAKIASSDITNVVTTGALDNTNSYTKLEDVGKALPIHLEYQEVFMLASRTICDYYNHDRAKEYPGENVALHPVYKQRTLRDRPNVILVPVPEFTTSQRVIVTPANNIAWLHDWRNSGPEMVFQPINVKEIQFQLKHGMGVGIDLYSDIVVNDQA